MPTALTGVGATGGVGTATPSVRIALTGVSASLFQGIIGKNVGAGDVLAITQPMPTLTMVGETGAVAAMAIAVPAPTLVMTGQVALTGDLALATAPVTFAMTGITGAAGRLTLAAPMPQLVMDGGAGVTLRMPAPTLVMTGLQGLLGHLAIATPAPQLVMVGSAPVQGALAIAAPAPALSMDGQSGIVAQLQLLLSKPLLVMSGSVDVLGQLVITAPPPTVAMRGTFVAVGSVALAMPMPQLAMTGIVAGTTAQVAAVRTTVVLQTQRMAVSQYTNFPFNSFALFGGRYLGASASGIFDLSGDTDAGTAIDARARTGVSDLNTPNVKRVDRVYVGYRAAGRMQVWVTVNEDQTRGYALPPSDDKLRGAHVRLGKGVEARYWQFEIRNEAGCDFTLDTLEVKPTVLPRRVGRVDA